MSSTSFFFADACTRRIASALAVCVATALPAQPALPGTALLTGDTNRSEEMRAGMEQFLDRHLTTVTAERASRWQRDTTSPAAYIASVAANRQRLGTIIGAVEPRAADTEPRFVSSPGQVAIRGDTDLFTVYAVRWPVLGEVEAEGLLLEPKGRVVARIVALPDADQTPEMLVGLQSGLAPASQFARRLAENGCQVLIPTLVSRGDAYSGSALLNRFTNQPHREWIYRQAYTLGRHIIGYEVSTIRAGIDWFARQNERQPAKIAVVGWGEGGLLALFAAALDLRIEATLVSGYFGPREQVWAEPIYRNLFGQLREFGDAEIASLIAPRTLMVEASSAPDVTGPPTPRPGLRASAASGRIATAPFAAVKSEFERAQKLTGPFASSLHLRPMPASPQAAVDESTLLAFLQVLQPSLAGLAPPGALTVKGGSSSDAGARQRRQVAGWERHTQELLERARGVRDETFWKPVQAATPDAWTKSMQPRRAMFWNEIIGRLPVDSNSGEVRSRQIYDRPDSTGYEVVLDVAPTGILWGYLLLPKDLAAGERRPVIVAQHGLSGVPADLLNEDPTARANRVYHAFALQLVRRGYVVFVPHFPWRTDEDYRRLQRKANPLGLSLFSFILAQHERLLDWLGQQPWADPQRIGLYGLSWGGKVALRVPALLPRYALAVCSGDFNEWIWKNATTSWGGSYMFAPEPDMFDFNLGMTFGHAEMAAMIAPRPFMVERGHDDGVGTDEWVAFEYARVRRLYDRLGAGAQTEIEFFNGGHEINAVGTFNFIQRHFNWPPSATKR